MGLTVYSTVQYSLLRPGGGTHSLAWERLDRNSGRCIRGALRNFTRNDKGSNHWRWQNYILHKDKEEDEENRSVTNLDPD